MKNRVVVTGLGVVAPNGVRVSEFTKSIQKGVSGITSHPKLKELGFSCQIGGVPTISEEKIKEYFTDLQLKNFNSDNILYGVIAGMDALKDAGIRSAAKEEEPLWDLGIIFGSGNSSVEKFRESFYKIDDGNVRRLGSTSVAQTMASSVSAHLGGMIGAGNRVTGNASACATGTEAIVMGYEHISSGKATQMLCGSSNDGGPYVWGGFDAMRILPHRYNENPAVASRPMSDDASGFVPGCGAGALVLESLESAKKREATIYAEVLGGSVNSGGQRGAGSMTAPNSVAVQRCITESLKQAEIDASEIDYINGHLTATAKDSLEIQNWSEALGRKGADFPYINSLKGMTGHCLAASGSIEAVSTILQLQKGFVFPNINCETIHPEIEKMIALERIPKKVVKTNLQTAIKASFGFGDVNACVIFRRKN
ncbi:beta-ketoacyl-[acyl-carrier-protein] synthase family protein [Marixanthomonas ophiurae]|uniref:3-oxoacyl-[acyl-carrier-protein] synthase 1 n=1 Tax=Marixanthomonas ophiurae TaxID=387659 RepID=A0A3E1Q7L5_9FLAO|nr:beta-ketoacyl-[acyl-carrier-protein] synthase family protein [Marixanthomonas ophiurae]RFN58125.1 beta-ketoacyl-[acyl-carrier-protein] synthase family protein [Marixanthomonas ophiurae]